MKISIKNIALCIAILSFLVIGCKDDINNSNNNPVTFTIYGKVTNENGNVISNAKVSLEGQEVFTNYLGMYLFKDIEISGGGSFLKVDKRFYFTSGRRIQAKEGSIKKVNIQLFQGNEVNSFSSSTGGEIALNNEGLKIEFQADGFAYPDGQPYNGDVLLEYAFIPVEHENLANIAPGGLSAINAEGEEVILASYGMLGVELNGGNINLAAGSTAKITIPVANEFLADAPSTIPLWHWNEETGFWEEEGTATLQGNAYVGDVSHFSFWNCDAPFPVVELSFQIVDENNNPLTYEYIAATINSSGIIRGGYTDDNGYVINKFPKDEVIQLNIGEDFWSCYTNSYYLNENIGPFQENTDAGVLMLSASLDNIVQIQGTIDDCMNENEEGYYLFVENSNNSNCRWEFYVDNDNFDVQFEVDGDDDYKVTIYDITNVTTSNTYTVNNGLNDIGMVSVCDNTGEYFRLEIDNGQEFNMVALSDGQIFHDEVNDQINTIDSTLVLINIGIGQNGQLGFVINYTDENDKLNTSTLSYLYSDYSNFTTQESFYIISCDNDSNISCNPQILTLSEFGDSGEYLGGTISGELEEHSFNNITLHNYTMDFRLKID